MKATAVYDVSEVRISAVCRSERRDVMVFVDRDDQLDVEWYWLRLIGGAEGRYSMSSIEQRGLAKLE